MCLLGTLREFKWLIKFRILLIYWNCESKVFLASHPDASHKSFRDESVFECGGFLIDDLLKIDSFISEKLIPTLTELTVFTRGNRL